jgi:hypothetical protein
MQLHESIIMNYNTLKSEEFNENMLKLWDNNIESKSLINTIKPDYLHFSIRSCKEKLPPTLKIHELKGFHDCVSLALYEECISYNNYIELIQIHLREIEKYVLVDINLFPIEWKNMALTLQLQRVPNEWVTSTSWPCVHSLKSWINCKPFIVKYSLKN